MDHNAVVDQKLTEKYLLGELDPKTRDEFEDHYFECSHCALDVRLGALFVDESKAILAEERVLPDRPMRPVAPLKAPWLSWLRPAFAAPAMAMLLAVLAFQNLVTIPQIRHDLSRPQVFSSWTSVNVGTYGGEAPVVRTAPGQAFLLFVRIPPDPAFVSYTADLYNPAGRLEWSLKIPALAEQDQFPVQIPAANRESGIYKLAIRGLTTAGETKPVGQASFDLQNKK